MTKQPKDEIVYKVEPIVRESLPDGPPNVAESIKYLRGKCEPLRGKHGAIAAYHVLVVIDALEGKLAPNPPKRRIRL